MKLPEILLCIIAVNAAAALSAERIYPEKPLRVIVGFPPGGPADTVARLIAQPIAQSLGKTIVVENAPGAGGNIAADRVAKAAPDGYSLGLVTEAQMLINPALYKLPFDPAVDFSPISQLAVAPYLLVVANAVAARNVRELVGLANARPGVLTFASPGAGSTPHVAGELFKLITGAEIRHVPYKGVGPAIPDLIEARVTMMFSPIATGVPLVRDGKLRALAVTSSGRSAVLPDIPSLAESGYRDFEVTGWLALVAPANTPISVVRRLHLETTKALALPEVRATLANLGLEAAGNSPEAFAAIIKPGIEKWSNVIKRSGIKPD